MTSGHVAVTVSGARPPEAVRVAVNGAPSRDRDMVNHRVGRLVGELDPILVPVDQICVVDDQKVGWAPAS